MAVNTNEVVALLSIQPRYSEAIFSGKKIIEFRKRAFKRNVSLILVYTSSPVKKVIGYFEIEKIVCKNPRQLWQEFSSSGSISEEDYFQYYRGKTQAFGILIKYAETFERPRNLRELGRGIVPPQSFRYLDKRVMKNLGIGPMVAA